MNIAFPVLLLTLALLPGFLFRFGWLRGTFRRSPIGVTTLMNDWGWLITTSLFFHSLMGYIFKAWHVPPRLDVILALLIGNFGKDNHLLDKAINDIVQRRWVYVGYLFATYLLAFLAGQALHYLIRLHHWDRQYPMLRLPNDWHYLLDRQENAAPFELHANERTDGNAREVSIVPDVYLTAVVDLKGKDGSYLIRGVVRDWTFTPAGDLDQVELMDVYRRPLTKDRTGNEEPMQGKKVRGEYYQIIGDSFILKRSEMISLNLQYLYHWNLDTEEATTQVEDEEDDDDQENDGQEDEEQDSERETTEQDPAEPEPLPAQSN